MIERVNEELRRRVKTQGPHPSEEAVLNVIFGLFAAGMIRLRRLDGWQTLADVSKLATKAA